MRTLIFIYVLLALGPGLQLYAQQPERALNFHKLGIQDGLHDGTVRCLGQDKYGYIWIATAGGINRYDGKRIEQFVSIAGDSTSPYASQPRCFFSDRQGRFWIGTETGLMEFDFERNHFRRLPIFKSYFIRDILQWQDSILYITTTRGLLKYNINTKSLLDYANPASGGPELLRQNGTLDMVLFKGKLYLSTGRGLLLFDPATQRVQRLPMLQLEGMQVFTMAIDKGGNIWMGLHDKIKLARMSADFTRLDVYDQYLTSDQYTQPLNVMDIIVDSEQRVWVATLRDGLLQYRPQTNSFVAHLYNPYLSTSPTANTYRTLIEDDDGLIWLGCDINGVNYFDPDYTLFQTLLPFADELDQRSRASARAVAEDQQGNLWMGNHDGVSCYNPATGKYKEWRNILGKSPVLYSNTVRSMACDAENNIWIGTSSGVNRYNQQTGVMEFVDPQHLPTSFYNAINPDNSGNIWFCTNDTASLYWYNFSEKKFYNITQHPQLKQFARTAPTSYVLEDSKHRLWISLARKGLIMHDKRNGFTKLLSANDSSMHTIIGNQIVDIKEDRHGMIWLSSLTGVSCLHPETGLVQSFSKQNGLPGNFASPLCVDPLNRVWVGVNGGLVMIDSSRKHVIRFGLGDGLPALGFNEHAGIVTRSGKFIMPGTRGYISWHPLDYKPQTASLRFYLHQYTVNEQAFRPEGLPDGKQRIRLQAQQNAFSLFLTALNYRNPDHVWYAYKLEGFEDDWHYTQDPRAVYTNVDGGRYTFLYKASSTNTGWDEIPAKTAIITLETIFYKAWWFRMLIGLLMAASIYALYRYRLQQHKQIMSLEGKATMLEREKATIQYDSLKQQLNPHFLFNSLTSLRSLIKTDSKTAAWFLDGLSKVYRYVLKSADQELVLLQDEVSFVKTFAELQRVRFGEGLQVAINIDAAAEQRRIAPVVLQNLVENAIKHNTTGTDSPLVVEIFTTGDRLKVRNNLQRYRVVETSNKQGLQSLQNLYSFYTDQPILIEEDEHYFTISIPLL